MIETRKVIKISNRLTFTLPFKWCKKWNVKEGDKLPFFIDEKELAIFPTDKEIPECQEK